MKTISLDLRERIVAAYDRGEGTREEIGHRFCVSAAFVAKLLHQRKRTGDIGPRRGSRGRQPKLLGTHRQQLRTLLAKQPDLTLAELRDAIGVNCTIQAIHYVLAAMGLTYKKRRFERANKTDQTSPGRGGAGVGSREVSIRRG